MSVFSSPIGRVAGVTQTIPADYRAPIPRIPGLSWLHVYRAGIGTTDRLSTLAGSGGSDATITGTPTLISGGAPDGGPVLRMDGSQTITFSASGVTSYGSVWVVVGRPAADCVFLQDTDGFMMRMQCSGQTLQFGKRSAEQSGLSATRQFGVFAGIWGNPFAQPLTNQLGTGGGNTTSWSVNPTNLECKFNGDLVAIYVGMLDTPASGLSNSNTTALFDAIYPLVRPSGSKSMLFHGNSFFATIGDRTYEQSIVGQVAAAWSNWKVGSLATSGLTSQNLGKFSVQQGDGATSVTAAVYSEVTNDLSFGPNTGNGTAAGNELLFQIRARKAARPATKHIFTNCLYRTLVSNTQVDNANAVLDAIFTVATADPTIFTSSDSTLAGCALIRINSLGITTADGIHPDVAGDAAIAAKIVLAAGYLGLAN